MAENSGISWTDHSFAPWFGCTKVSDGPKGACAGCYAEHLTVNRFGKAEWGPHADRVRSAESTWKQPLTWNRRAQRDGKRPFVFCSHLSDVFDNQVPVEWRRDLFDLIKATPHLTWLLLTKRPQNIAKLFCEATGQLHDRYGIVDPHGWPSNAAIGCTVVTQAEADRDVPWLLDAKHALKPAFAFLSMEPLMEDVLLAGSWLNQGDNGRHGGAYLNWIITGGETDQGEHKARPTPMDAFRSLRDQCAAAGVPFHLKQMGDVIEATERARSDRWVANFLVGERDKPDRESIAWDIHDKAVFRQDGRLYVRAGKKLTGRALDGVIHDARPVVR